MVGWFKVLSLVLVIVLIAGPVIYIRSKGIGLVGSSNTLSDKTISTIQLMTSSDPNIVAIQIIKFDLQRNARHVIYSDISITEIRDTYESIIASSMNVTFPIFTEDVVQNRRLVRLINHNYECGPYTETLSYKYSPESAKYIATVCSVAIPPSFGKFKGIIAIFLRVPPDAYAVDTIMIMAKNISEMVSYEIE